MSKDLYNKRLAASWLAKNNDLILRLPFTSKGNLSEEFVVLDVNKVPMYWENYPFSLYCGKNPLKYDLIFYFCDAIKMSKKTKKPLKKMILNT